MENRDNGGSQLGRLVTLLEDAGYSRCDEQRLLRRKEYRLTDSGVMLECSRGSCEFRFDTTGSLVDHVILDCAV